MVYQGLISENLPHGRGRAIFSDDELYIGEYQRGLKHGFGKFESLDSTYVGFYENDFKSGFGTTQNTAENWSHVGFYLFDRRHGLGKYKNE